MFLKKGVLKICSKFTGEHPCRSGISINYSCSEISLKTCMFERSFSKALFKLFFIVTDLTTRGHNSCCDKRGIEKYS